MCSQTLDMYVALVTFLVYVFKHVRETIAMIFYLRCFAWTGSSRVKHEPLHVVTGYVADPRTGMNITTTRPLSRIKILESVVYVLIILAKLSVCFATVIIGSGSVIRSATDLDLVFNALAVVFILELDEVFYTIFVARMWVAFTKAPAITCVVTKNDVHFQMAYPYIVFLAGIAMHFFCIAFWCHFWPEEGAGAFYAQPKSGAPAITNATNTTSESAAGDTDWSSGWEWWGSDEGGAGGGGRSRG